MDDLAPVGVRLLLSGIWELDASLLCVTVLFQLASMVIAIRVPAFVLTDKAKVLAFLLLCSYYIPRITHGVVPKMKATLQEFFGLDMDGAECRLDGKRAAHIVLHYVKTITKTLGCLLGLN